MTKNAKRIAKTMGAKFVERLPDLDGGAFEAMRMAKLLQDRLQSGQGKRPGPGVANWTRRLKVPMSEATEQRLAKLAEVFSRQQKHRLTPMQVAAQLLEAAVENAAAHLNER